MDNQFSVSEVPQRFMVNNSEYDAEVLITVQCKDKKLRKLIMDSIFVDHQNGTLHYECASQDPESLTFLKHILVKYLKTI